MTYGRPKILDPQLLARRGAELAPAFGSASPFPHVVVDDLIPADALTMVAAEVAAMSEAGLAHAFDNAYQQKLGVGDETNWADTTRQLMQELNSGVFVGFLGTLDANGQGTAQVAIPSSLVLPAPIRLDLAFGALDPVAGVVHTSNSFGFELP